MTSNVVVGKRIGFWQAMPLGKKLFIFGAPAVGVVVAVRSFLAGDATWGGIYAFIAVVLALVAMSFWGDAKRTSEIVSRCPACGVERQRAFAPSLGGSTSAACGACLAYLTLDGDSLEVREQPIDASGGFFAIEAAQYQTVAPRDFQMPTMCAVCGTPDAPQLRTLDRLSQPDAGVIGAVASGVATEAAYETGVARVDRRYGSNTPSSGAELDMQLMNVQMHVCTDHVKLTERGCEYDDGMLVFSSYRYYKAFCELNHVTAEKASSDPATARVVSQV